MKLLIKNGELINPAGKSGKLDVLVENGKVVKIDQNITDSQAKIIDAKGLGVLPGLVDIHCHLREPGFEYKEDIASGTLAAVHGGFTSICCMPNTNPVVDNAAVIAFIKQRASEASNAKVYPIGAITKGLLGEEITEMGELKSAGAIAFSDDGKPVSNAGVMRHAMQYAIGFDMLLISHSEELSLVDGYLNEGYMSSLLGLKGIPRAAEEIAVAREIILAEGLHTRIHIAHISTRGSVELIRHAKARGVKVTCETCPHYFSATDDWAEQYDTSTKINPPLRTKDDVEAIIEGLKDGTIDCIATDHAPHHIDEKRVEYAIALNGITGFETAFGLGVKNLVEPGYIKIERLVELMTISPARVIGINAGVIAEGEAADITLADLNAEYTLSAGDTYTKGKNSPFFGKPLKGRIIHTFVDGRQVIADSKKA